MEKSKSRKVTPVNSQRSVTCGVCNASLSQFRNLKRHFTNKHPNMAHFEAATATIDHWDREAERMREQEEREQRLQEEQLAQDQLEEEQRQQEQLEHEQEMEQQRLALEREKEEAELEEQARLLLEEENDHQSDCSEVAQRSPFYSALSVNLTDANSRSVDPMEVVEELPGNQSLQNEFMDDNMDLNELSDADFQSPYMKELFEELNDEPSSSHKKHRYPINDNIAHLDLNVNAKLDNILQQLDELKIAGSTEAKENFSQLSSKLDSLSETIAKLQTGKANENKNASLTGPGDNKAFLEEAKYAKSIRDLRKKLPSLEFHFSTELEKDEGIPDGLFCTTCIPSNYSLRNLSGQAGFMAYNFAAGEDFSERQQPRSFINLKAHSVAHMESSIHIKKDKQYQDELSYRSSAEFINRNRRIGRTLGMNAYKSIVSNQSFKSYENEVAADFAKGVDVGSKNHSFHFASEMVDPYYDVIRERILDQMNQPLKGTGRVSCLSIFSDKYSPSRHTLDVLGVSVYSQNEIQTLFVSADVVKDHTGAGIANSLADSMDKYFGSQNWKKRYIGSSADGGQLALNYSTYLDEIVTDSELGKAFYSHIWDYSHCLELAYKDVALKRDSAHTWVKDRQSVINSLHHSIGHGKSYERFCDLAEQSGERAYAPIGFSATRFLAYNSDTLDKFMRNYPTLYEKLNSDEDTDLYRINNVPFVSEVSGLQDIFSSLKSLSTTLQIPDLYPWQAIKSVSSGITKLRRISAILLDADIAHTDVNSFPDQQPLLPHLSHSIDQMLNGNTPSFRGKRLMNKESVPNGYSTRYISNHPQYTEENLNAQLSNSRRRLGNFANALSSSLEERMFRPNLPRQKNDSLLLSSRLFSFDDILSRPKNEVPEEDLKRYADLAKDANHLPRNISEEELYAQYSTFSASVYDNSEAYVRSHVDEQKRYLERSFYNSVICNGRYNAESFKDVSHLAHISTLRLGNEAVAEAMGSMIKRHADGRGRRNPEGLAKEVSIHWNGPPPNINAIPIVEKGLEIRFKSDNPADWNLTSTESRQSRLGLNSISTVLKRKNEEKGRVDFSSS